MVHLHPPGPRPGAAGRSGRGAAGLAAGALSRDVLPARLPLAPRGLRPLRPAGRAKRAGRAGGRAALSRQNRLRPAAGAGDRQRDPLAGARRLARDRAHRRPAAVRLPEPASDPRGGRAGGVGGRRAAGGRGARPGLAGQNDLVVSHGRPPAETGPPPANPESPDRARRRCAERAGDRRTRRTEGAARWR